MYVRLAFAVAAHLESEILIVDEVLAVGDAEFQKKCLGKMGQVSKGEGRTIIFVSHNMGAVQKLCKKAILLENGLVLLDGHVKSVMDKYINTGKLSRSLYNIAPPQHLDQVHGFAYELRIENSFGKLLNEIPVGCAWQIVVKFKIIKPVEHFIIAIGLVSSTEANIRTSWSLEQDLDPGDYTAVFQENNLILAMDVYTINLGLSSYEKTIQYIENVASLTISDVTVPELDDTIIRTAGTGFILNPMEIKILKNSLD